MIKKLFPFFILWSSFAKADIDFYTYGGFGTTVDGFKRVALTYSNVSFLALVVSFVVMGVIASLIKQFGSTVTTLGNGSNEIKGFTPLSAIIPAMIGMVLLKGLVLPTTTVHVYDPVKNQYQPVAGVPSFIAYVGGGLNLVERTYIEDVVDSSSAYPYSNNANGVSFKLLYDAIESAPNYIDAYDLMNVKRFYADCGVQALSNDGSSIDIQKLKSGTDDLSTLLSNMTAASIYTTMFSKTNKSGTTYTCSQAFNSFLEPILSDTTTQNGALAKVCAKNDFDETNIQQKQACIDRLEDAIGMIYKSGSSIDANAFIRNAMISSAITQQITDDNPDGAIKSMANQTMIANGLSSAIGSQEWVGSLKSMLTIIILGLMPILTLLIVTPLISKALPLMLSLFAFVTLWTVIDASMYQATLDSMTRTMNDIKQHNLGLAAFWLTPSASVKALTVLGDARSSALSIAAMLASALFGLSAYGMSSVGQSTMSKVENASNDASQDSVNPVHSSQYVDSVTDAQSSSNIHATKGTAAQTEAKTFDKVESISNAQANMGTQGLNAIDAGSNSGAVSGTRGGAEDNAHMRNGGISESVGAMATTETNQSIGNAQGSENAAVAEGTNVMGMSERLTNDEKRTDLNKLDGREEGSAALGQDLYDLESHKSEVDQVVEYGNTRKDEQNIGFIKDANSTGNDEFDLGYASKKLAVLGDMGVSNQIMATGGEVDRITERDVSAEVKSYEEFVGEKYVREQTGTRLEESAFYSGVETELDNVANSKLQQQTTLDESVSAAEFKAYDEYNKNLTGANVAGANGGIDEYTTMKGNVSNAEDAAHAENIQRTAMAFGMSDQEIASARDKAQNNQMAVSSEMTDKIMESNPSALTAAQEEALRNGGTLTGNMEVDETGGLRITDSTASSGASTDIDSSTRNDTSYKEDSSAVYDNSYRRDESNTVDMSKTFDASNTTDTSFTNDSSVTTDTSTRIDNSYKKDSSKTIDDSVSVITGADSGNLTSSYGVVTDGEKLYTLLSNEESLDGKANIAATSTAYALSNIYESNNQIDKSTTDQMSVGLSGDSIPFVDGSVSGTISSNDSDTFRSNSMYNSLNTAYKDLDIEANNRGMIGEQKDQWVAQQYSDMNKLLIESLDTRNGLYAQEEKVESVVSQYFEDNDYSTPHSQSFLAKVQEGRDN